MKELSVIDGNLYADFGNGAKQVCDRIIDCAVVDRGIKNNHGEVTTPLMERLLESKVIDVPPPEVKAIDLFPSPGNPVWAVGPLTNEFRNGLGTFRSGYKAVAEKIGEHIETLVAVPAHARRPANINYQKSEVAKAKS